MASIPAKTRAAVAAKPAAVRAWTEDVVIPTYLPAPPDRNPMFLERRVYQGSSGRVYPLPFTDRIAETRINRRWRAVWIENEYLRVMVLPEIGGRIHRLFDKTNGYDLIYHQEVIKPALVGLAGPWISGGIEFNWPQHHRPATFLPVDVEVQSHADGSKTVWCSDHDPMNRMKGMHGVRLRPGVAVMELRVRVYNRTPLVQTFLWWANVATRVHEAYQSFFPPDVHYIADHAKRATSAYPLCQGHYYGVNYGERGRKGIPTHERPSQFSPPHTACRSHIPRDTHGEPTSNSSPCPVPNYAPNDLTWYANIPVPTSYMCMGSQEDFFGGYDHRAQAGLVHIADHRIAPGKKQWTWGNHEFGYAWDRHLTDPDANGECAPYIELMAGVFTDNQPDFSFLMPGETRAWSQYWYPIQRIGPAQHANLRAAVSLELGSTHFRIGVSVTRKFRKAVIRLERRDGSAAAEWDADLAPGKPFILESPQARKSWKVGNTILRVLDSDGGEIIVYRPQPPSKGDVPPPANEPPAPVDIPSADELYVTGLHLEQYRHATRCPTLYWREALRRDPLDARCNSAMGVWHLRRGEFQLAEACFRRAIKRLTSRNPNPLDGEPYYHLGLCLRFLGRDDEAYDALSKATWNHAWAGAACHALAEIDCGRQRLKEADSHIHRAILQGDFDNNRARNLLVMALRKRGGQRRLKLARSGLTVLRRGDPLDWWGRHLRGNPLTCDTQTLLDLSLDLARAGFHAEAIELLGARASERLGAGSARNSRQANAGGPNGLPSPDPRELGVGPLLHYHLGWLHMKRGDRDAALAEFRRAAAQPPDYCFPSRLEEIAILEVAIAANPKDARAPYYLGNLLYDRRRHDEAIRLWERAAKLDPSFAIVWRNLGIGYFNSRHEPTRARTAYDKAFRANPTDARLLYERDQLWKRLGDAPAKRLCELEKHLGLVQQRDDLSIELCALYNQTGQHVKAMQLLASRRFQPWEGGEGLALGQHVRTQLALGRAALRQGDFPCARSHFENALSAPPNLGEAWHFLSNRSGILYWLGEACTALGERAKARQCWRAAATFEGDFREMRVESFSEMTYYSALSWERLGLRNCGKKLLRELLAFARNLSKAPAQIDYFATSLPTMLLFEDDLAARQQVAAQFLQAQACAGLGRAAAARAHLAAVLKRDPNHALAADLMEERQ